MSYYGENWTYTLDEKHGFGILFDDRGERIYRQVFYEDGTLAAAEGAEDFSSAVRELEREANNQWIGKIVRERARKLTEHASFRFVPGKDCGITVTVESGMEKSRVRIVKPEKSFYYDTSCSCSKSRCAHIVASGTLLEQRLAGLRHAYITTELPVRKNLFLEDELTEKAFSLNDRQTELSDLEEMHDVLRLLHAAGSDEYVWLFHQKLLDLQPRYDYDARFLESVFSHLLFALFDDPGYRETILDSGEYADAEEYEERQHRSNRVSFKRVLKDYQRVVKALEKEDYGEDPQKEFLLKYRFDWAGLLRYYAEGKPALEETDLPYLEKTAGEAKNNPGPIAAVAAKLDQMAGSAQAGAVLRSLTQPLPESDRVEIYGALRNLSLTPEEIRSLGREEQLKMIRNTPLSTESFCHIMDDLMAGLDPAVRGGFILHAIEQTRFSGNAPLKRAVAERAKDLPDNRLLLAFALHQLGIRETAVPRPGDPERELGTWFSCGYEILRQGDRVVAVFTVREPESGAILLEVRGENGSLQLQNTLYDDLGYSPELIRAVCIRGREKQFDEDLERNRDELDAALFEQKNYQFAREYAQLCESLAEGKILYSESGKVDIEWLIYREEEYNALAFRIGRSRKYIVKDAMEFMKAFRSGATTEYGRDLVLTHDPENLNESDAALIKMLMTAKYTKGRKSESNNRRYITISSALLGNIVEGLAGRTVYWNEVPCTIRLEPRKIRLRIDGKYQLSTDLNKNRQEFLNLIGKGYLLTHSGDRKTDYLDRVEGPAEEMNLIRLIDQHPAVSIKPILKDFRKNIYARFFELFDVEKSVEREFTLSQLRLNTYFDFEKGVITARTVILRDEKEIRPEQLTDRIDRARLELLDTALRGLGFEEGRLAEEGRVLAFFKMDFTRLRTLTNVYLSENLRNKELKSIGRPVIRVTYQNNLIRVFLEKSEFSESELEQIIAGLRKKRRYILLNGSQIIDLDSDAARDFGETVRDFGMDPRDLYRKKTVSMINAIKAFSHERSCRVDKYIRDMMEEIRSFKEAEIAVPPLRAQLRDYQTEGFRWLSILTKYNMGGILADDMGLGKTIQMIALLRNDPGRKPSLVVCPKSLVFNWISEFARFDGTTRVQAVYGPDAKRTELISAISAKEKTVYITSYDSLRNDISKYAVEFNYVILDEAQYIKNVNALKTKSVKELKARHRFALTGTPIENSIVDLWSIFDFILPGYFEELSSFRELEPELIARKAAPFILRRVKEDVLEDLPAKYERILSAEMTAGQRGLYDAMRQEARKALEEGGKAFDLLPYLTRMRQVCVDPGMFVEDYHGGSGKMDMLASLIPEYLEAHHRILIFSQFVRALESVQTMLRGKGIPTYFLSGSTPARERVEMMDSFNNGSGTDVFLISLKAGGTGLNLIGADTVIHLDPWWNVAAENQASDRTHRIGQTRNVEIIRLIADDSIEQRVVELQDLKKEVVRQVISDDDGSVTSARLEDIAFMLDEAR